ncbi:MAG: FAD-dependent oxidoreductase [Dehalococcoidia bacterium]|nr:FAD-dependent oxidoreductase [Dehalococcoidia bacterium]
MPFSNLFKPGRIGPLELKNRIVMPAMGTGLAGKDGEIGDEIVNWYARRARGGAGLITVEVSLMETSIDPFRLAHHSFVRVDHPRFIPGLTRLAKGIHDNGAKAAIQLSLGGGAYDKGGPWDPKADATKLQYISPSGIPPVGSSIKPRILGTAEIEKMVELSGVAAGHVKAAGFDLIEIHAHHGYLMGQFLSPFFNKRTDKYGITTDGPCRLVLEVLEAMRKATGPGFAITAKFSVDEYIEGGIDIPHAQAIARKLEEAGVDGITVSGGGAGGKMPPNPPYFFPRGCWVHLGKALKDVVKVPVAVPGRLQEPRLANRVLRDGKADFIAIGRGLIADPDWPQKVAAGKVRDICWCLSCNECRENTVVRGEPIRCAVNPVAGRETQYDSIAPAKTRKKVVVVGGGPGGLEAACTAAFRGHNVTLFERRNHLGGLMALAGVHNEEIEAFNNYLSRQVGKLPIKVITRTEATPTLVNGMKPDAVIVATGGTFPEYSVPGIGRNNVFSSKDLLNLTDGKPLKKGLVLRLLTTVGKPFITTSLVRSFLGRGFPIGNRVAIIGGQFAGCSLGLALAQRGKQVTLIEESARIGNQMQTHAMIAFNDQVADGKVKVLTSTTIGEITAKGVVAAGNQKDTVLIEVDTVILALDPKPSSGAMADEIKGHVGQVYTIGDAKSFQRIKAAVAEGFDTAMSL